MLEAMMNDLGWGCRRRGKQARSCSMLLAEAEPAKHISNGQHRAVVNCASWARLVNALDGMMAPACSSVRFRSGSD